MLGGSGGDLNSQVSVIFSAKGYFLEDLQGLHASLAAVYLSACGKDAFSFPLGAHRRKMCEE